MPNPTIEQPLIQFLQNELAIPAESISVALRQDEPLNLLPMVLWQYGLVSLEQLEQIFDWMEVSNRQV